MSNGGTVEELDAQVKVLDEAMQLHRNDAHDAEQQAVANPTVTSWQDTATEHRAIASEYADEIALLHGEIARLPRQRQPGD